MTIRIRNDSISAVVRSYAVDSHHTVIWLKMAPQHPKTIGAIWDTWWYSSAPGCSSVTKKLPAADAPELALGHNARPRLLRLIAPCSLSQ